MRNRNYLDFEEEKLWSDTQSHENFLRDLNYAISKIKYVINQ